MLGRPRHFLIAAIGVFLLVNGSFLQAQVRTSSNYQIQSDSINIGGGYSSSTNFQQESTIGEVATGRSTSTAFNINAGYQQMQESFLSMTVGGDVVMDTVIDGVIGGVSNGTTTVVVITDDPAGYELYIQAESDPAMQSGGSSIADYPDPATPSYDFNFTSGEAFFGYSPEGSDIVDAFKNNGSNLCNVGTSDDLDACWSGLSDVGQGRQIADRANANHPIGSTTTIKFRVGVGATANPTADTYIATTTVTALPQ